MRIKSVDHFWHCKRTNFTPPFCKTYKIYGPNTDKGLVEGNERNVFIILILYINMYPFFFPFQISKEEPIFVFLLGRGSEGLGSPCYLYNIINLFTSIAKTWTLLDVLIWGSLSNNRLVYGTGFRTRVGSMYLVMVKILFFFFDINFKVKTTLVLRCFGFRLLTKTFFTRSISVKGLWEDGIQGGVDFQKC